MYYKIKYNYEEVKNMKKNNMLLFVSLTFFLFFISYVFPQAYRGKGKVKGIVKDETGEAIPEVSVKLYHVKSASGYTTKTDEKGEWFGNWIRGGLWYIDFEKEGYFPKKISVEIYETKSNPDIEIVMKKLKGKVIPKDVLDKLDKGNKLYEEKKYNEAIEEFKKILELYPDVYLININIANCYYDLGDYQKAIEYYQKVLDKEPENNNALLGIGNSYSQLKSEKALEYYSKIDLDAVQDPLVLYNIATMHYNSGDYKNALKFYEQSVKIKGDFTDALYQLGVTYLALGDNEKSKAAFEKYLQYDSTSDKAKQVKEFLDYLKNPQK